MTAGGDVKVRNNNKKKINRTECRAQKQSYACMDTSYMIEMALKVSKRRMDYSVELLGQWLCDHIKNLMHTSYHKY